MNLSKQERDANVDTLRRLARAIRRQRVTISEQGFYLDDHDAMHFEPSRACLSVMRSAADRLRAARVK